MARKMSNTTRIKKLNERDEREYGPAKKEGAHYTNSELKFFLMGLLEGIPFVSLSHQSRQIAWNFEEEDYNEDTRSCPFFRTGGRSRKAVEGLRDSFQSDAKRVQHFVLDVDRSCCDYHPFEKEFILNCVGKGPRTKHKPLTFDRVSELVGRTPDALERIVKKWLSKPARTLMDAVKEDSSFEEEVKIAKKKLTKTKNILAGGAKEHKSTAVNDEDFDSVNGRTTRALYAIQDLPVDGLSKENKSILRSHILAWRDMLDAKFDSLLHD